MLRQISVKKRASNPKALRNTHHQSTRSLLQRGKDLKETLRQKEYELDFFIKTGKALTESLEFKKVLRVILSAARRLVRCEDWALLLLDNSGKSLHYSVGKTASLKVLKKVRYKMGEGPAGWVAKNEQALLIPDFSKQTQYKKEERFYPHIIVRNLLCLPIVCNNQVIGVIQVLNRIGQNQFSENDLDLLEKLLDLSSSAIARSDLYQKMSDLVTTDDLTHLYNLRYLDHVLDVEMKRSRRYKSFLSLIFIDLDFFKQVNDNHGHLMGSKVLVEMASILIESLRAVDVIVRYGGDEFVVLLPNTDLKKASRVAERVRIAIHEFDFLKEEGLSLKITASFGIACYPKHANARNDLIHLADRAMYVSKTNGRDMISVTMNDKLKTL